MMDNELGPRERDLLAAYRNQRVMPATSRARVWASLAGGTGPGGGGAIAASGGSQASRVAALGLVVAAGITLFVLGVGGPSLEDRGESIAVVEAIAGVSVRERARDPDPDPILVPAEPVHVAAPAPIEIHEPTPALLDPITEAPRPRARARKPVSAAPIALAPGPSRERELIEAAHAALAKGDSEATFAALDEHARDFAEGVFAEEREALDAIAHCKSGDLERGRTRAQAFLDEHPRAVLAARVRRTCDLEGAPSE
jgi:hypothetical protein